MLSFLFQVNKSNISERKKNLKKLKISEKNNEKIEDLIDKASLDFSDESDLINSKIRKYFNS